MTRTDDLRAAHAARAGARSKLKAAAVAVKRTRATAAAAPFLGTGVNSPADSPQKAKRANSPRVLRRPVTRKRGRPDSYRVSYPERAHKLTLLGLTQQELAVHFNLSCRAFERMIARHKDLRQAIENAGSTADAEVAASLRQRALGYSHSEEKVFCTPNGRVRRVMTTKHYPPSEVAAMMWLSNRQRATGRWCWRSSVDLSNSDSSFRMFAEAMREADRTLEGKFRVIEPARLKQGSG